MRKIGQIQGHDRRKLMRDTLSMLEGACGWKPVPPKLVEVAHLTPLAVRELRASDDVNSSHVLRAWNQSTVARSFVIADNISRMRGLLHLLRYWRTVQRDEPEDQEAIDAVLKVWHFCRDHWGIENPPHDPRDWDRYCEGHVLAMMRRKERQRS